MATETINITRANVYHIAEGISVIISQHNGGTPTFEQLWASPDEAQKLDIYYRDAVGDLERRLMKWVSQSHGQFDLTADGTDYTLTLTLSEHWPTRLDGLLKNKVQDYLVHSVTAGWLNDFAEITNKADYQAMSAQDIDDIIDIICMRNYAFAESARGSDSADKDIPDDISADQRGEDTDKDIPTPYREAGRRRRDNARKSGLDDKPIMARNRTNRHQDDAMVDTRRDYTDMSGTDLGYSIEDPLGQIYRREPAFLREGRVCYPQHPPVAPCATPDRIPTYPPKDPKRYEEPPVHAIPPKFTDLPFHADGKGWSDADKYDKEREERFVNSHVCGQPGGDDKDMFVPEEDPEEEESEE